MFRSMRKTTIVKRVFAATAAAVFTTAIALTGTSAPAQAVPKGCTTYKTWSVPGWADTWCTGGTGYFITRIYCAMTPGGRGAYFSGKWAGVDDALPLSVAKCSSTYPYLVDAWHEKK
ncbi:hypothetical protein [Micromonospora sp. DT31]|uniref:hypothetical protein n=1 Tax=Micromonospora sp. DT31 TaxID=3393434 RepID=UPI003CF5F1DA